MSGAGTLRRASDRGVEHRVGRALLLNASFEPLCVVSARRAVVLVLKEKAEIVDRNGAEFRSERAVVPVPTVIRLVHFVRVPYRTRVPLSRRAVFARDGHRCQYCGRGRREPRPRRARARGAARHTWENVVASCRSCNARKEDRLPHEAGLRLRRAPRAPHADLWLVATAGSLDPAWTPYLPGPRGRPRLVARLRPLRAPAGRGVVRTLRTGLRRRLGELVSALRSRSRRRRRRRRQLAARTTPRPDGLGGRLAPSSRSLSRRRGRRWGRARERPLRGASALVGAVGSAGLWAWWVVGGGESVLWVRSGAEGVDGWRSGA